MSTYTHYPFEWLQLLCNICYTLLFDFFEQPCTSGIHQLHLFGFFETDVCQHKNLLEPCFPFHAFIGYAQLFGKHIYMLNTRTTLDVINRINDTATTISNICAVHKIIIQLLWHWPWRVTAINQIHLTSVSPFNVRQALLPCVRPHLNLLFLDNLVCSFLVNSPLPCDERPHFFHLFVFL